LGRGVPCPRRHHHRNRHSAALNSCASRKSWVAITGGGCGMAVVCLESSLGGSGVSSSGTDNLIFLTMCSSPFGLRRPRLLDLGTIPTKRLLDEIFDPKWRPSRAISKCLSAMAQLNR
jgi:hypothetical protein